LHIMIQDFPACCDSMVPTYLAHLSYLSATASKSNRDDLLTEGICNIRVHMFQLDTFRLSMNRYRDCFVQRKNQKIISAYPNFHIFRRRAFSYYRFFPGIRVLPRIYYTCIQILALLNRLSDLLKTLSLAEGKAT